MSSLPPLPDAIRTTCRVYFGTREKRFRDNRCDKCPIRTPCLAHGGRPARTIEELGASRRTFVDEATTILEASCP